MPADLDALLAEPECERFDAKSQVNPESRKDMLELVGDIVAMANTYGGRILIGNAENTISGSHQKLFDRARLDDQVNRFVEPRLGGIRSSVMENRYVVVEVEKSQVPPHVFKVDGNYQEGNKHFHVFRRGDVFGRHSSKSERANRSDYDRWYEEQRQRLFEHVKMVFDAGPDARIQVSEVAGAPVRIDPNAPDAQPVYDLLTPEPYRDLQQELVGGLKGWKTSRLALNERQILKAYQSRDRVENAEVLELLLRSCWERWLPGYYWAQRIEPARLFAVLEEAVRADTYPASSEALKISSLLPRHIAKAMMEVAERSKMGSVRRLCQKFEPVLRARTKKQEAYAKLFHPGATVRYQFGDEKREVKLSSFSEEILDSVLETLLQGKKENKGAFKAAELMVYGTELTKIETAIAEALPAEPTEDISTP